MLGLLLAACVAPVPSAPEVAAALARGDAAHAAFDYEGARLEYEEAVRLDPAAVQARARLAHVLNDLGGEEEAAGRKGDARARFDRALGIAEALQRDAPDRPEGHHAVAATLGHLTPFLSGPAKVAAARRIDESARRATGLDPCLASAWAVRAITLREIASLGGFVRGLARAALGGLPAGTLADAEWHLRAAAALDPEDPFLHYQLALTLERAGRDGEAEGELRRAVALPDREARDRRNRADAEARLSRLAVDSPRR